MEEKKKVFIRGLKGRGNEVIDILTKLGAINTVSRYNDNSDYIYFINHRNEISCALVNSEMGAIIMDNYKEIALPRGRWKDGDVLVNNKFSGCYAVFKKYNNDGTFEVYFTLDQKTAHFDTAAFVEAFHLATTAEIENLPLLFCFLMGRLNEAGLCLPKNVERNPLPDNETKRLEESDD